MYFLQTYFFALVLFLHGAISGSSTSVIPTSATTAATTAVSPTEFLLKESSQLTIAQNQVCAKSLNFFLMFVVHLLNY
jgi:hypothetical protein